MVAHGCTAIAAPRTEGRPQAAREHGPHDPRAPRPAPVALPLPRRVREGRRRAGAGERPGGGAGGDHRRDRGVRAARPRRRRLPDRAQVAQRRRASPPTSWPRRWSSTRPRASPAPSRTAPSCAATPTRSSRAPSSPPGPMGARTVVIATKASFTQEIARLRDAIDEMTQGGLDGRPRHLHLRGARRVPLRRGDRAARGRSTAGRRSPASRRRTGAASSRSSRPTPMPPPTAGWPPTSRWPVTRPTRRPRSSTTSRRWPTSRRSSPAARPGSARRAPTGRRARWSARSPAPPARAGSARS